MKDVGRTLDSQGTLVELHQERIELLKNIRKDLALILKVWTRKRKKITVIESQRKMAIPMRDAIEFIPRIFDPEILYFYNLQFVSNGPRKVRMNPVERHKILPIFQPSCMLATKSMGNPYRQTKNSVRIRLARRRW